MSEKVAIELEIILVCITNEIHCFKTKRFFFQPLFEVRYSEHSKTASPHSSSDMLYTANVKH